MPEDPSTWSPFRIQVFIFFECWYILGFFMFFTSSL
jgi:hypothetical protein